MRAAAMLAFLVLSGLALSACAVTDAGEMVVDAGATAAGTVVGAAGDVAGAAADTVTGEDDNNK